MNLYIRKLKSRLRTLLIPFILWNLLYLVYSLCFKRDDLLADMEGKSWMRIFWDGNPDGGNPILGPLWYVRDLIKCCVISPLIYVLIRYLRFWSIFIFVFVLTMDLTLHWYLWNLANMAFAFFGLGSLFGFYKIDITKKADVFVIPLLICCIVIYWLAYIWGENEMTKYFQILYIAVMGFGAFYLTKLLVCKYKFRIPSPFDSSSFYIYCVHMFFYEFSFGIAYSFNLVHGTRSIAIPIAIFMCFLTYYLLNRFCPKVLGVLCGNR